MAAKSPASSLGRNEPSGFSILPYDILQNLCRVIDEVSVTGNRAHALNELSKTNRFLRDISVAQVFRKLTIRGDWNSATKRLEEMDDFPTIIGNVKNFEFAITSSKEMGSPSTVIASLLSRRLMQMTKLEELVLGIPDFDTAAFSSNMARMNVTLPKVRGVTIGPFSDFVIRWCPNIESVTINGYDWPYFDGDMDSIALVEALGKTQHVKNVVIQRHWPVNTARALLRSLPNLQSLGMYTSEYDGPIAAYLTELPRLQTLQRLALSDASDLGLGYNPPWCGNAYLDGEGNTNTRLVAQLAADREEAEKKVLMMVAPLCRNLTTLWIGPHTKAEILRGKDGNFEGVSWRTGADGDET